MAAVKDVFDFLDGLAAFDTQMDFDNAGFLVGRSDRQVHRLLVSLDITEAVAEEARAMGAELIVSHHPVIFHPAKSITDRDPLGRTLLALIEGGVAAICAHTNLDAAVGGVNDVLAARLGLTDTVVLEPSGTDRQGRPIGIGRAGKAAPGSPTAAADYAAFVKEALGANGVRYVDAGRPVSRVAVGGGACGDMGHLALALGCDTFVTSDAKYNQFLDARDMGLNLIDAGHYPTENVVCPVLADALRAAFPEVEIALTKGHREVFSYR